MKTNITIDIKPKDFISQCSHDDIVELIMWIEKKSFYDIGRKIAENPDYTYHLESLYKHVLYHRLKGYHQIENKEGL